MNSLAAPPARSLPCWPVATEQGATKLGVVGGVVA
eukprot:CAMPEP_0179314742 /NCGR_PEP_ID=MMETSP0797-20121207/54661_1 /TAXON_ID=47934 /ORGANISM="Dinophysis acuminata, Strain DAEP01" /LENGTH=34 /DNA_ID= /DNA_START= /DNA_END= /DNA_ORIENTATION=